MGAAGHVCVGYARCCSTRAGTMAPLCSLLACRLWARAFGAQSNTLTWRHNSGVDRARRSLRSWGRCNFVVNCVTYKHGEPLLTGLPTMAAACDLAGMKDEVAEEFAETVKK